SLSTARKQLDGTRKLLEDNDARFQKTIKFFSYSPKKPDKAIFDFFSTWSSFCLDFKDVWKKEQVRLQKLNLQLAQKAAQDIALKQKKSLEDTCKKEKGGLKSRLLNFEKKRSIGRSSRSQTPDTSLVVPPGSQ
ncbi:unnamed protein product, partial [Notodromas monacha]